MTGCFNLSCQNVLFLAKIPAECTRFYTWSTDYVQVNLSWLQGKSISSSDKWTEALTSLPILYLCQNTFQIPMLNDSIMHSWINAEHTDAWPTIPPAYSQHEHFSQRNFYLWPQNWRAALKIMDKPQKGFHQCSSTYNDRRICCCTMWIPAIRRLLHGITLRFNVYVCCFH